VTPPQQTESADIEIFYDGGCPICRREIDQLRRWDRRSLMEFTDIDESSFSPSDVGKSREELMSQLHGRLPDGSWLTGVEVFRRMYAAVGFRRLVALSRLPVLSHFAEFGYAVFARFRLRITGRNSTQRCTAANCAAPTK